MSNNKGVVKHTEACSQMECYNRCFQKNIKLSEKDADRKMELSQFDLNICIFNISPPQEILMGHRVKGRQWQWKEDKGK